MNLTKAIFRIPTRRSLSLSNTSSVAILTLLLCEAAAIAQPGTPVWTNRYNELGVGEADAYEMAVDRSGNVFVTGESGGDYATIAYSNAGAPLWTNRYGSPENGYDTPYGVVVDSGGTVFVTGWSANRYATIAYSNAGVPLWTNLYSRPGNGSDSAHAIVVDTGGTVFVTGLSDGEYVTIAYSNAGVPLWTNFYNEPSHGGNATAIAVDSSGNVFVTGLLNAIGGFADYATIKYSNQGVPLWTNRYIGPGNSVDSVQAMAVDYSGNAFVTGHSIGSGSGFDYATIAYSEAGVPLWTNRYNGPDNRNDFAKAIAVDVSGKVFVTGDSYGANRSDYTTIAYSSAGVPLWTNHYGGPGNDDDLVNAIAVDSSGNVFVTGQSYGANSSDYATIAYSNTGVPLWTNRYNVTASGYDAANAIAVDDCGNVFVTGVSNGDGDSYDYVTIKYSSMSSCPSNSPIPLSSQIAGNRIILSWTNGAFTLQSAPTVDGTYTNISGATSPYTNLDSGIQQFFRLKAN